VRVGPCLARGRGRSRPPPPLFYLLLLKDIQGGDDPSIFESLEAHGNNMATFSLCDDHT